jgi:hypothetical protein
MGVRRTLDGLRNPHSHCPFEIGSVFFCLSSVICHEKRCHKMKEIMGFKATRPKSVRIKALPTRPTKSVRFGEPRASRSFGVLLARVACCLATSTV